MRAVTSNELGAPEAMQALSASPTRGKLALRVA
ncbi:MAG: hypothetical protein QOF83_3219 [Solirubrobacteraceae bacterium]|jgi:hypothetical protein|nr:hypothetical protein [Solirubrobacteraceae bacterium]